ncbi:sensor domain-containing protein [Curvibacter delicatus]|jgi:diguanylate cyclase (GGDEF)-like protein/PAS domain S-box-containing protein|uniref:sensor domain-containing protein n=1 Tax=Curvibacter delicatus TaxID=80879 RepID=UPI0008297C9D|nr:EAL domain-containing protein [Curvibacter delicatus]
MEPDDDIEEIKRLRAALDVARLRLLNLGQSEEAAAQDLAEMEKRLRSERLFAVAFQESPEALVLSRLSDGLLVDVNQEWLNLTGYTREEAIGHTVVELRHWTDAQTRQKALTPLLTQGRLRGLDATVFLKDGAPCLVRLSGSVIEVFDEKLILMRVKDITAERMAEEALRAGEMALERANEQLNAQLELYEFTERLAHVGHWTASPDGQTIHWSDGLLKVAGMTRSPDMPIQESRSYTHPDDLPAFLEARQRMDGEVFEYRWCHPDGRVLWLRTRMHRQFRRDGSSTDFGVVQDVTQEHQARQALQERLDFIQKITSRIPDMVFQMCTQANGRMTFPFASDALFRMFQIRPEDAREDASFVFAFIHPDDLSGVRASMRLSAVDGGTWHHEFRVRLQDGSVRWLLGNAVVHVEGEGDIVSYGALTDITERKKSEMQLQESEARFRSLTDLSSDWYWEIDEEFRFTRFDGYRKGKSATTAQASIGQTRWEIGAVNMTEEDWEAHRRVLASHQQFKDLELQRLDADGQSYWISISGTPMYDAQGRFRGYRGIGRDISTRKRAEDETQRLAFYDTLTGLPNRRLLMDRLSQTMAISARSHHHCALLFIDLDNFKDLNDSLGHDVGDQLLEQVASRLVMCIREGDTAARFGGDEFVVMLEGLSEVADEAASQAEIVAEKILVSLNQPYELMGKQHSSTPSIGIALFSGHEPGADELLKRADVAMYQAKAAGRNTLRFYDPEMQAAVMARAALDADLRQGLQRQELRLHYQPVVDVEGRTTGFEALVRWQHPQRGLVGPGEFIDLAEQTGLILPIGQWVLQAACQQLVAWEGQAATQGLTLSVNVSARQFRRSDFVAQVLAVLHDCGADPQRLKLELTESVLLSDVEDAIRKMSALRSCGVRFALDDFGTGYSSLAYLKRLPLDQLKIDQTFVRDVLEDANDAAIVRTILALAHSMDLMAVAEGVETEGQRQFLLANGCTLFQGYLFGRPVPIETIALPA